MQHSVSIFWFRRDLRLEDNAGLFHALNSDYPVLPIFIFDSDILDKLPKDDSRVTFIHEQLSQIQNQLIKVNSSIAVYHGKPIDVFKKLSVEFNIKEVYTNHDYEPYAIARDRDIESLLSENNIPFDTYKDHVIYERNEIVKKDGSPYKVYTPYSKKWLEQFKTDGLTFYPSEDFLSNTIKTQDLPFLSLKDIGFKTSSIQIKNYNIVDSIIDDYEATRNFPAKESTSRIGPHLRFGTISIRTVVKKASEHKNITYLKELIWREFFMQILWHFPQTVNKSFKPQYDRIVWRNNESEFKKWCDGETGYPLVDAGMRQLNKTGFMHNRVTDACRQFFMQAPSYRLALGRSIFCRKIA